MKHNKLRAKDFDGAIMAILNVSESNIPDSLRRALVEFAKTLHAEKVRLTLPPEPPTED